MARNPRDLAKVEDVEALRAEIQSLREEIQNQGQRAGLELKQELAKLLSDDQKKRATADLANKVDTAKGLIEKEATALAKDDPALAEVIREVSARVQKVRNLTGGASEAAVHETLEQARDGLVRLHALVEERGDNWLNAIQKLKPSDLALDPQKLLDSYKGDAGRKELEKLADQLLPGEDKGSLQKLTAEELLHKIAPNLQATAPLLAVLPKEAMPESLQPYIPVAKKLVEAQNAEQAAQTMTDAALEMAIMTGNPYIIAAAVLLKILSFRFGGGSGSGSGGKGGPESGGSTAGNGRGGRTSSGTVASSSPRRGGLPGPEFTSAPPGDGPPGPETDPGLDAEVIFAGPEVLFRKKAGSANFRILCDSQAVLGKPSETGNGPLYLLPWKDKAQLTVVKVNFEQREVLLRLTMPQLTKGEYLLRVPESGSTNLPTLLPGTIL
jgi:hypothetical protein